MLYWYQYAVVPALVAPSESNVTLMVLGCHFAYNVLLPVEPLVICVTLFVNAASEYQPPNVYPVLVGAAKVMVSVSTVYVPGLVSAFVPPFNSYPMVYSPSTTHCAYSVVFAALSHLRAAVPSVP